MKKVSFIIHGNINSKSRIEATIRENCSGHSIKYDIYYTEHENHGTTLASQESKKGVDAIVSVGGDGSLNDVMNGIMLAHEEVGLLELPILACWPKGSGNDFVRSAKTPNKLTEILNLINQHATQNIDVKRLSFTNRKGEDEKRWSMNITDIGMGGKVVERMNKYPRWLPSKLRYQMAIFTTLLTYKHQKVTIESDVINEEAEIMNIAICNGQYFGAGLCIAPDAKLNDGILNLVVIKKIGVLDYIKELGNLKKSIKLDHPEVSFHEIRKLTLNPKLPLPIDMDGEFIGYTPLTVEVEEQKIKFLSSR